MRSFLWFSLVAVPLGVVFQARIPGPGGEAIAATSSISVDTTHTCTGSGTTANVTCTFSGAGSTSSGDAIIVFVTNTLGTASGSPTAPTVTDNKAGGSSTYARDCNATAVNTFKVDVFSTANTASGITQVTFHPGSNYSSWMFWAVRVSGLATSAILNGCGSAISSTGNSGNALSTLASNTLTTTQDAQVFGIFGDRVSTTGTITWGNDWTGYSKLTDSDGDEAALGFVNGAWTRGQFTSVSHTSQASGSSMAYIVAYNSNVTGSAPAGKSPTIHVDFEGLTSATQITDTTMNASTHGPCNWVGASEVYTGLNGSTSGQEAMLTAATVDGTTRKDTGGTKGMQVDLTQTTHGAVTCTYASNVSTSGVVMGHMFFASANSAQQVGDFIMYGGSGDLVGSGYMNSEWIPEVKSGGNWTCLAGNCFITLTPDAWVWRTCLYVDNGGTQRCRAYNASTGAQIGSELTNTAVAGANPATSFFFGRPGAEGSTVADSEYWDNLTIDLSGTSSWPLLAKAVPEMWRKEYLAAILPIRHFLDLKDSTHPFYRQNPRLLWGDTYR